MRERDPRSSRRRQSTRPAPSRGSADVRRWPRTRRLANAAAAKTISSAGRRAPLARATGRGRRRERETRPTAIRWDGGCGRVNDYHQTQGSEFCRDACAERTGAQPDHRLYAKAADADVGADDRVERWVSLDQPTPSKMLVMASRLYEPEMVASATAISRRRQHDDRLRRDIGQRGEETCQTARRPATSAGSWCPTVVKPTMNPASDVGPRLRMLSRTCPSGASFGTMSRSTWISPKVTKQPRRPTENISLLAARQLQAPRTRAARCPPDRARIVGRRHRRCDRRRDRTDGPLICRVAPCSRRDSAPRSLLDPECPTTAW